MLPVGGMQKQKPPKYHPAQWLTLPRPGRTCCAAAAGMARPEEHWVDFVSGNATLPTLPTMIVIKASSPYGGGVVHASGWAAGGLGSCLQAQFRQPTLAHKVQPQAATHPTTPSWPCLNCTNLCRARCSDRSGTTCPSSTPPPAPSVPPGPPSPRTSCKCGTGEMSMMRLCL